MTSSEKKLYIFDSDELTNLWQRSDRSKIWDQFVAMVMGGQIRTIPQVICELKKFPVILDAYRSLKSTMRISATEQYAPSVTSKMAEIERACPKMIDYLYRGPCDLADPWLVALGCVYGYTVVTHEKKSGSGVSKSVFTACRRMGVDCINLHEFLKSNRMF